jgi:hypothetical protein
MKRIFYLYLAFAISAQLQAQHVTINPGGITPAPTHPRISYDAILALPNPQEGDLAFDTTNKCLRVYINGNWICSYQNPNTYIPPITFVLSAGGTNVDLAKDVAVDNSGNIYLAGAYYGTTKFGVVEKTSAGAADIFVAKYNSGGVLQWVQSAGGEGEDVAESIAVDGNGNVYITGYYHTDATFDQTTLTAQGGQEIFVVKYNSSGAQQWVKAAGGEQDDEGISIALDINSNVYVTGSYTDYAVFDLTHNKTAVGENDVFIAKYNSSGALQWVESAGGNDKDQGKEIVVDPLGYLYLTGYFSATADFGGTSKTSAGLTDIFIAKYAFNGGFEWVRSAGGSADDYGRSIAVYNSGNIYLTGYYYGTATFGSTNISSVGGYEIFLARYSSTGDFEWVQSAGGAGFDNGFGVAASGNNVYLTGYFTGLATFGTNSVSGQGETIFVARYTHTGVCQGVQAAGGPGQDFGMSVTIDNSGKAYITGTYVGTATFHTTTKTSQGLSDIFVIRLE